MNIDGLSQEQFKRIEYLVPGGRKGKRGLRSNSLLFINALLWMARSGARWKDLPERFGPYQTVKRRYYRWIENGVIERIFEALIKEADFEWLMIDSTIIRAHKHAAGAPLKRGMRHPKDWVAAKAGIPQNCTQSVMV